MYHEENDEWGGSLNRLELLLSIGLCIPDLAYKGRLSTNSGLHSWTPRIVCCYLQPYLPGDMTRYSSMIQMIRDQ